MSGHRSHRTKEVVRDQHTAEGFEPLRATIITSLSFAEIDAIKINQTATYAELFTVIAPYIVAWNAMGRVIGTDQFEPLPPPSEAGPEILQKIDPNDSTWLAYKLRTVHMGDDDLKKELTPSGSTPGGPSEPDSTSPEPETSLANRADSI
jgi:hypothetical protein